MSKSAQRPLSSALFLTAALALGGIVAPAAVAAPVDAKVDGAHSGIGFVAQTKLFDAVGKFKSYRVSGKVDPDDFTKSSFKVTVDVATLDTDNGARDDDLRSKNFFDVDKYPQSTFTTKSIKKTGKETYNITGTLQIKDVKKDITFPVKVVTGEMKKGQKVLSVHGKKKVNRRKWGIDYTSGMLMPTIKDNVDITYDMNFIL